MAPSSNITWLTHMVNDEFVIPALSMGHSIRTFSCQQSSYGVTIRVAGDLQNAR